MFDTDFNDPTFQRFLAACKKRRLSEEELRKCIVDYQNNVNKQENFDKILHSVGLQIYAVTKDYNMDCFQKAVQYMAQETLPRYNPEATTKFITYLTNGCRKVISTHLRQRHTGKNTLIQKAARLEEFTDFAPTPPEQAVINELHERLPEELDKALQHPKISDTDRYIINCILNFQTCRTIGKQLGISGQAVGYKIKRIRRYMEEFDDDNGGTLRELAEIGTIPKSQYTPPDVYPKPQFVPIASRI